MESIGNIYHLGGVRQASYEPGGATCTFDSANYFYERIPLNINGKEKHVYGNRLEWHVKEWIRETERGNTTANFQNWMAEKWDGGLEAESVHYLSDGERNQTEVVINQGVLEQIGLDATGSRKRMPAGTYAFVIGDILAADGSSSPRLFAAPKGPTEAGPLQHSSFLRAGSVRSAGMFTLDDAGVVTSVRDQSGHYKPSVKEMAYFIQYLQEQKVDILDMYIDNSTNWFLRLLSRVFGFKRGQSAASWYREVGSFLLPE